MQVQTKGAKDVRDLLRQDLSIAHIIREDKEPVQLTFIARCLD